MNEDPISHTDAQLTRWIDNMPGAVPPENLNPRETARLRADAESVAALLRKHIPASVEPPYPDFFNSQVLKKIRDDQVRLKESLGDPFWSALGAWLRSPWLAAAAAAVVVVVAASTLGPRDRGDADTGTRVLSVFSPEPNATARVLPARNHAAVIITVDGLEAFPDDRAVVGLLNDEAHHPLVAALQP